MRMRKQCALWLALVALLAVALLPGAGFMEDAPQEAPEGAAEVAKMAEMAEQPLDAAESIPEGIILTGKVKAADSITVQAPFGGTAEAFELFEGQRVKAGDALLTLSTQKVYAPCDGVVRGIFASVGDAASYVQGRYGALCSIEPSERFVIETDTAQGFESAENRFLHVGEPVTLQGASMNRRGAGRISQVSGEKYTVEVLSGDLVIGDSATIYRGAAMSVEGRIGRGTVARAASVSIQADGSVLVVHVKEGDEVQRGALLFEMVSGALEGMQAGSALVEAPADGIIASISAQAGQSVTKNQTLLTLYTLGRLRLITSINEMDAQSLRVGQRVSIGFDSIPDKRFEGAISFISGVGTTSDNYTEYAVYVDFTPDDQVRIGMSGTGYAPASVREVP